MKCNQCRRMFLSLQGTGSRCLGGRMGCSVLLSTVQGSCWTTNHWSLGGFPGPVLLCACPVHFHTQQLLAAKEIGVPGNLWHGSDRILKVVFCMLSSFCGREKRFRYFLWLAPRVAGDNLSYCFFPAIPSVHLSSLSTIPGLHLNPSFFLLEVNQARPGGCWPSMPSWIQILTTFQAGLLCVWYFNSVCLLYHISTLSLHYEPASLAHYNKMVIFLGRRKFV